MDTQIQEPTFQQDGLEFYEVGKQEYGDGYVAAGFVSGHPEDTVYLILSRQRESGLENTLVLLRPDELMALITCASGTLWSVLLTDHLQAAGLIPNE